MRTSKGLVKTGVRCWSGWDTCFLLIFCILVVPGIQPMTVDSRESLSRDEYLLVCPVTKDVNEKNKGILVRHISGDDYRDKESLKKTTSLACDWPSLDSTDLRCSSLDGLTVKALLPNRVVIKVPETNLRKDGYYQCHIVPQNGFPATVCIVLHSDDRDDSLTGDDISPDDGNHSLPANTDPPGDGKISLTADADSPGDEKYSLTADAHSPGDEKYSLTADAHSPDDGNHTLPADNKPPGDGKISITVDADCAEGGYPKGLLVPILIITVITMVLLLMETIVLIIFIKRHRRQKMWKSLKETPETESLIPSRIVLKQNDDYFKKQQSQVSSADSGLNDTDQTSTEGSTNSEE